MIPRENYWMNRKIVCREWDETDPRWIKYKADREKKRERQDALKAMLGR